MPIATIVGLVSPWVGVDVVIGQLAEAAKLTRVFLRRTDHAAGDVIQASVRNAVAGGGQGISITLSDGAAYGTGTGEVSIAPGGLIYLRITSSGASSMNLGGWVEIEAPAGVTEGTGAPLGPYQNPAYGILHAGALAGFAAMTTKYGTVTGFGVERLIDARTALLMRFSGSQTDHHVEIDRGTGTLEAVDRCWIPAGHNLSGATVRVYSGTSSPASTLRGSSPTVAGTGAIDFSFTTTTDRYVRVLFDGTGAWELGELWLTRRRTTVRGLDPGWGSPLVVPTELIEFPTREISTVLGPARRTYDITYHDVDDAGSDAVLLTDVANLGRAAAFLFWPPHAGTLPFVAKLREDLDREQDSPQPSIKLGHEYGFRLIEQTS
jgi:hypothetical protein